MRKTAGALLISFFLFFSLPAMLPPVAEAVSNPPFSGAAGQVYPAGQARALLGKGQWITLDRVYPVPASGNFKTGKGSLSFLFKEGTRMDIGASSEMGVKRLADGALAVVMCKGVMAVNVAAAGRIAIVTPMGQILESGPKGFAGVIYVKGWQTRIRTLAGNLEAGADKKLAAMKQSCTALSVARSPAIDPPVFKPVGSSGPGTGLLVGGGLGGGLAAGVAAELNSSGAASPYAP